MTVQQLIDRLRDFPPEMEVKALWDTCPVFTVHRVERYQGVALIDCGDNDGDWDDLLRYETQESVIQLARKTDAGNP